MSLITKIRVTDFDNKKTISMADLAYQKRRPASRPSRPERGVLRIVPLGGLEEVGRNMIVFEYEKDIIIVDMGLQFPEEDMPGIDYIIPNVGYLKGKEKNIRGVIITHGHYDHIGAIPHLLPRLGNPTIYATPLTRGIILKRQEDFVDCPKLDIEVVKVGQKIQLGPFKIDFFHVNHNIPDSVGLAIETPVGQVVHTGDFKFDHSPINEEPADLAKITELGRRGTLLLMSDSTDAEIPGYSLSEKTIQENFRSIFENIKGRIIIATFASLLTRIQQVIWLAEKFNRKVAVDGYSMKANVDIAKALGYLKAKNGTLINIKEATRVPDEKLVVLCTGAQGEGNAVLMRLANNEHRFIKIKPGDTVIFSSSVVPGNERSVQNLRDSLCKKGARVIHYEMMDIHTGGHAHIEDLKIMLNLIKPKFFIPVEGSYYMLKLHAEIAESVDIPRENIVIPNNGDIVLLDKKSIRIKDKEKAPTSYIMVDGLGVGDVGQVVLRDRQMMAKDGMFVIIVTVDSQTGKVRNSPDIISRGFIYMRESKQLLRQVREKVKQIVHQATGQQSQINQAFIKENIRDKIGQFLYNKTERRPMVLPVVIEV